MPSCKPLEKKGPCHGLAGGETVLNSEYVIATKCYFELYCKHFQKKLHKTVRWQEKVQDGYLPVSTQRKKVQDMDLLGRKGPQNSSRKRSRMGSFLQTLKEKRSQTWTFWREKVHKTVER